MERTYENATKNREREPSMAFEGLLANLPILVCGLAFALALACDVFG